MFLIADNELKTRYLIGLSTLVVVNYQQSSIMHVLNPTHARLEQGKAFSVILE